MRRNLISILILALLIVNVVLTAIMMFSITNTTKKTAALVDNIASAIALELSDPGAASLSSGPAIAVEDIEVYSIPDSMTIPLKIGEDGKSHYCLLSVSFSINTKDKDYKTYGSDLTAQAELIKSDINSVVGSYTMEEAQADQEGMKAEILSRVQRLFGSQFIYAVSFSSIMFQ